MRTLLGLETPDGGTIVRKTGLRIGYVPQRFDIDRALPMTVTRFLTLGDTARKPRVAGVLAEVGAERVANQQLGELSGGELQRVVLARALLNDPDLLVLDEPVRGVDYVGEAELYGLIGRLRDTRGLGVILISHDLHVVMAQSDRVICLNRHVCCSGVPETVAQHPEYTRLFGPEQARTFAVYQHHHDHRHDLAGDTAPLSNADGERPCRRQAVIELEPFLVRALAASLALAVVAAPLGSLVIWNRMAYFGETISTASLLGIALGLALGIDITAPVIAVTLAMAGLLILLSRQKIVPLDAILGLMHHGALALGVIATLSLERPGRRSHGLPVRRHLRRHDDRPLLGIRRRRPGARRTRLAMAADAAPRRPRGAGLGRRRQPRRS